MTKSLLQQVMVKSAKPENDTDVNAIIEKITLIGRGVWVRKSHIEEKLK